MHLVAVKCGSSARGNSSRKGKLETLHLCVFLIRIVDFNRNFYLFNRERSFDIGNPSDSFSEFSTSAEKPISKGRRRDEKYETESPKEHPVSTKKLRLLLPSTLVLVSRLPFEILVVSKNRFGY